MNNITQNEYNEIKNDTSLSVVSFINNRRLSTYSGLTYKKAVEEILLKQQQGATCLLIKNLPDLEVSWVFEDYKKYINKED